MLAGICVSRFSNFRDAISKCVKYSGKVSVDLELHLFYNKKYGEFKSIHDSLVNLCDFLYKSNG